MHEVKGRVSILIPLYNRVNYIKEAINSVLSQSFKDFDIIVVDDGSTDGGDELIIPFVDAGQVKLIRHPNNANCGQSKSLNLALSHAKGEFIAILDSDDIFLPNKLASQVHFLQSHEEIGLVYGMGYAIDANGNELYEILSPSHHEPQDPNQILLDCYFHLPVGSLVRRSVYDRTGGFDEGLRAGQDHDMLIRMAEITLFGFLAERVYCYRRHSDSISAKGLEARWRNAQVILEKAIARYPYRNTIVKKRRAVINFRLAQALFNSRKSRLEAMCRMLYAAFLDPTRAFKVLLGSEKTS